jgi:hypothetical protein
MGYDFDRFRDDLLWRIPYLNARLEDPLAEWPGVLILDTPTGLSAEAFDLGDATARDRLARELLPSRIADQRARRFAWLMPAWRRVGETDEECLLLVVGERGRVEAALARVVRVDGQRPRLSRFSFGPFGPGARRVSGRFVEPLEAALSAINRR